MRFYLLIISFFISLSVFAQKLPNGPDQQRWFKLNKRVGIITPIDYIIGFETDLAYIDKNSTTLLRGYFAHFFDNNIYGGIYYEQKVGVTSAKTTLDRNRYYGGNLKYESTGIYIGFYNKRNKVTYKKKLARLNFSIKSGLGRDYILDKETHEELNKKDYLLVFIPSVSLEKPISHFISVGVALNYHIITRIDIYYSQNQLSGFGGNVSIRFSIFHNPIIRVKPNDGFRNE